MPEDVMKKYKQGELPADYSNDFPKQGKKNKVDPAVFRMADERDY